MTRTRRGRFARARAVARSAASAFSRAHTPRAGDETQLSQERFPRGIEALAPPHTPAFGKRPTRWTARVRRARAERLAASDPPPPPLVHPPGRADPRRLTRRAHPTRGPAVVSKRRAPSPRVSVPGNSQSRISKKIRNRRPRLKTEPNFGAFSRLFREPPDRPDGHQQTPTRGWPRTTRRLQRTRPGRAHGRRRRPNSGGTRPEGRGPGTAAAREGTLAKQRRGE